MKRLAPPPADEESILLSAIEELSGGAVLVLDRELRVVGSTQRARQLLGAIPRGVSAAKLLCGQSTQRPIAEALAAGRAVTATVARIVASRERMLRIAAAPVQRQRVRVGWTLLIDEEPASGEGPELFHGMWTREPAMRKMFRIVEKVARTEASILVRGETGSGKELVATALHARSRRSTGPFRAINCAAMPAQLLESELFGHARGAFTGAVRDNPGHFKLTEKGTLFLDEVAELPLELQAKLLRVLETHTVMPVGARQPVAVDVRIVAATHRALRREVEAGRFRADLMYRLRVIPVFIPPLRARRGDIVLLTEKFVEAMNVHAERKILRIAQGAKDALSRYDWPGNVRELRNVLEYAYAIGEGPALRESDLPAELLDAATGAPGSLLEVNAYVPPPAGRDDARGPEAGRILRALERASGNRARAATSLGISRVTLWRRMKQFGLDQDDGAS